MDELHFDIRDLFRSIRLGWSGKKIWVGLCGLFVACVGYSVLVSGAHMLHGTSLSSLWHRYGLFPGAVFGEFGLGGSLLHLAGMLFALCVFLITTSLICKMTFQQLRGDDFFSPGDAWQFAKQYWKGVLFAPVAVLALFVFFVIVGILIGWVGNVIPVAGELLFALLLIPIFFAALVAVFMGLVFGVSLMMAPAIVGSVGEDPLEVVIQSFSLSWSQPWRLVLYGVWLKVIVCVGGLLLGAFTMAALWLITWTGGLFMEAKLANMFELAGGYLPVKPGNILPVQGNPWDWIVKNLSAPGNPSGSEIWAGRILGLMLVILSGFLVSYWQSVYASGTSLIYVILRRRKDGENLLEQEAEVPDVFETAAAEGEDDGEAETEADSPGTDSSDSG